MLKRSPLRKHSKNPLSVEKKKTWKLMSEYVRKRDKNKCFTCGAYGNQAGHFIHRDCLDYDEININAQCIHCNFFLHGNGTEYAIRLIKKYGIKKVEELKKRGNQIRRFTIQELKQLQEELQVKIKML